MANWTFDPSQYKEKNFDIIPVGDYRVRIEDVVEKTFNSNNQGYEITLAVNGYSSRVWYYLVLDPKDPAKTNQRIGDFFNSFGITSPVMNTGKQWIGMTGAVRIRHEQYNGEDRAKVAYCLNRSRQENLPAWKNMPGTPAPTATPTPTYTAAPTPTVDIPSDLPFEM